jgi:hypothetical protein
MSCPYFKNKYDTGFCSASPDIHVPGINEMSSLCFKADYHSCAIFCKFLAETDFVPGVKRIGNGGHANHKQGRVEWLV